MQKKETKATKDGRIGRLPEDTKAFYRSLSNFILEESADSNKADFLDSIFERLCEEAVPVSQNQTCSLTMEGLLPMADSQQLCRLFAALGQDWATVTTDRCAGHVLQTILGLLPKCFQAGGGKAGKGGGEAGATSQAAEASAVLDSLCRHLHSSLPDSALQTYSSHVLRALLELLAGVAVSEKIVRSRASRSQKAEKPPQLKVPGQGPWRKQMWEWFTKLTKKLFKTCDFDDHLVDANFNPVLQTVLLILQQRDQALLHKYCTKLIKRIKKTHAAAEEEESDEESERSGLPWLVQDEVGSYLAQLLLQMELPAHLATKRQTALFRGSLLAYAIHPTANFVLNSFLATVTSPEQGQQVLEELMPALETILAVNAVQLVISLADICHRLQIFQSKFVKKLMKAFHCLKPAERQSAFIPLLASMSTFEVLSKAASKDKASDDEDKPKKKKEKVPEYRITHVTTPGSLLLQKLLRFEDSDVVLSGIAALPASDLCYLASDPAGSHILDVFFQSPLVSSQHVQQVANTFKGYYGDLACSKHGSFTVEALWRKADLPLRKEIAFELSKEHARLRASMTGKIIYHKLFLEKFHHNQKEWLQQQQQQPWSGKRKFQPGSDNFQGKNKRRRPNKSGQN